jgi:HSP20 family protein
MSTRVPARYEPLSEIANVRDEVERFIRRGFGFDAGEFATTVGGWTPEFDVEESDESYVVHVELSGVKPEDISVSVEDGVLKLAGERRFYDEREVEGFRRVERRFGSFHRALRLPGKVDPEAVEARYIDGVLDVTVPKAEETKPHRIDVKRA